MGNTGEKGRKTKVSLNGKKEKKNNVDINARIQMT